jgi:hypothetical protein
MFDAPNSASLTDAFSLRMRRGKPRDVRPVHDRAG